ncbi:hypothetical protein C8R43DRAFT_929815 [Mycena crocata]|nr:hypothetical protein C8R43DRAFT_929815 [Mycena crocata]
MRASTGSLCIGCQNQLSTAQLILDPHYYAEASALLRSHSPVSDSMRVHIDTTMAAATSELKRYDALLDQISSQRAAVEALHNKYRALLSPIRTLPPEILLHIFRLIEPVNWSPPLEYAQWKKQPIRNIAYACSRWYNLVMGTPSLWSTITVDLRSGRSWIWRSERRLATRMIEFYLRLSQNSPLTLNLSVAKDDTKFILDLFDGQMQRCHDLSLSGQNFLLTDFLQSSDLRNLHHLRLATWVLPAATAAPIPHDVPQLRHFEFSGPQKALEGFPFEQLDTFAITVRPKNLAGALSILEHLQDSASFHLSVLYDGRDSLDLIQPRLSTVVAQVPSLSISLVREGHPDPAFTTTLLVYVLRNLSLPSLRHLSFAAPDGEPVIWAVWPDSGLPWSFRHASASTLISLDLTKILITEALLFETLSILPRLETLTLADYDDIELGPPAFLISDELFQRLAWTPADTCLVPRLRALNCRTYFQFTVEVYVEFLRSRLDEVGAGSAPFTSMMQPLFRRKPDFAPEVVAQLRVWTRAGRLVFSAPPA